MACFVFEDNVFKDVFSLERIAKDKQQAHVLLFILAQRKLARFEQKDANFVVTQSEDDPIATLQWLRQKFKTYSSHYTPSEQTELGDAFTVLQEHIAEPIPELELELDLFSVYQTQNFSVTPDVVTQANWLTIRERFWARQAYFVELACERFADETPFPQHAKDTDAAFKSVQQFAAMATRAKTEDTQRMSKTLHLLDRLIGFADSYRWFTPTTFAQMRELMQTLASAGIRETVEVSWDPFDQRLAIEREHVYAKQNDVNALVDKDARNTCISALQFLLVTLLLRMYGRQVYSENDGKYLFALARAAACCRVAWSTCWIKSVESIRQWALLASQVYTRIRYDPAGAPKKIGQVEWINVNDAERCTSFVYNAFRYWMNRQPIYDDDLRFLHSQRKNGFSKVTFERALSEPVIALAAVAVNMFPKPRTPQVSSAQPAYVHGEEDAPLVESGSDMDARRFAASIRWALTPREEEELQKALHPSTPEPDPYELAARYETLITYGVDRLKMRRTDAQQTAHHIVYSP